MPGSMAASSPFMGNQAAWIWGAGLGNSPLSLVQVGCARVRNLPLPGQQAPLSL